MTNALGDTASVSSPTDGAVDAGVAPSKSLRKFAWQRWDWRRGGRLGQGWDLRVLSVALLALGVGLIGSTAASSLGAGWAIVASSVFLWLCMLAAATFAFSRERPSGIFTFRSIDLLWAVSFGIALRILQGWVDGMDGGTFPATVMMDGKLPDEWWLATALPAGVAGPLVEESFFRGVILVTIFRLLLKGVGPLSAGATSVLISAGSFVFLHSAFSAVYLSDQIQLFIVGATCGCLVILTGRIWGAVLTHVVYNTSFLALIIIGSLLQ